METHLPRSSSLNFYSARFVTGDPARPQRLDRDLQGNLIGEQGVPGWLQSTPWAFNKALKYIHSRYSPAEIVVTENGFSSIERDEINDEGRIRFFREYLEAMSAAMRDGVRVGAYLAWSLLDNFEW